ncbi:UNVERIFIED_CONTAM: protein root UVB sensitive 4 [Sesamum radiatum]|uniref:Protein root UVB sensitive 4 n=1 Tax=Sesamum radiatum TaxID=300843 RepID=A0AAW2VQH3_SESRA
MKLTIQIPSHSQLYSTWALRYDPVEITKHVKPKNSLKSLALSSSLNTSFNFNHEYQEEEKLKPTNLNDKNPKNFNLPVVIRHSDTVSRCFWDGKELKLVSVDGSNAFSLWDFSLDYEDGMRKLGRVSGAAVRNFFLPREVGGNYLEYVKWKFLHRVFSSALQVLATQAMFRAIGIGYSRSLPSAAALNWVLKDGLGRLSRCIYTASLASAFDTNLKSAVHRSFAIADNLGEVSAKSQIQTVCFDNVGLLLAATFNIVFRNNQALPFVVYPIFSAIDLFGIYQGLKHVHLQTLTKDRLESIINIWIQQGYIPSPAEVSKREDINFLWSKDDDFYFICMESSNSGSGIRDACYIRNGLLLDKSSWDKALEAFDSSDSVLREWFALMEESKKSATIDLGLFIDKMSGLGWVCRNILLSSQEQARYNFVAD